MLKYIIFFSYFLILVLFALGKYLNIRRAKNNLKEFLWVFKENLESVSGYCRIRFKKSTAFGERFQIDGNEILTTRN